MSILNDATVEEINEAAEDLTQDLDKDLNQEASRTINIPHFDFSFLKTPTGSGSIEDYTDHVLNPNKSKGLAQMLRGFTGLAGELNLAILDITFGAFAFLKENKNTATKKPGSSDEVNIYEKPIINV